MTDTDRLRLRPLRRGIARRVQIGWHALRREERGNMLVLAAFSLIPLIGSVSLAMDMGIAYSNKSKLESAADAAALKGVRVAIDYFKDHLTETFDPTEDALQAAEVAADGAFRANLGTLGFGKGISHRVRVWRDGQHIKVLVSYGGTSEVTLGKVLGLDDVDLGGRVSTQASIPPYFQVIFLIDVSNSMGIGGTNAAITKLEDAVGCAFACHDPNHYNRPLDTRAWARGRVKLKIDYVQDALHAFLDAVDAAAEEVRVPRLYSVGLATFGTRYNYVLRPTTDLALARQMAGQVDVEPAIRYELNYGYTQTSQALDSLSRDLTNMGDGSSPSRRKTFVVFLTDGIEDVPVAATGWARKTGLSYATKCAVLKDQNMTMISILAPYPKVDGETYASLIAPYAAHMRATMQGCATDPEKWFFQADDGPAIIAAMKQAFANIQQLPTITE